MQPAPLRKIIHVDMDAFFASVEQRDDVQLRGRPVAVGSADRRGVVAAASYEARRFGVRSAMPSAEALRRCPDLVFVRPRFDVYKAVSAEIRAIFAEHTPLVEPLSLDEAYLDVTRPLTDHSTATALADAIRARIRAATGLTASAGVSYSKFLAKLASDQRKPDGLFVITPARADAFLSGLPVERFHGVGPVTAGKLVAAGIRTGAELRAVGRDALVRRFGRFGAVLHDMAWGRDDRPVRPDRPRKSIGSENTYRDDLHDRAAIVAAMAAQAGRVADAARARQIAGRTVTLKLRYADWRLVTRSRTLAEPVAAPDLLTRIGEALIDGELPLRAPVRLVGLSLSTLEPEESRAQLALGL